MKLLFKLSLGISIFVAVSCSTYKEETSSIQEVVGAVKSDAGLQTFYDQRKSKFFDEYFRPEFGGNVLTEKRENRLEFSDQTIFLAHFMMWQSTRIMKGDVSDALLRIDLALNHLLTKLVVPTTLPSSSAVNRGYFHRDNMTTNPLNIDGVSYEVKSDAQNGRDNEMSGDQLMHTLFSYYLILKAMDKVGVNTSDSQRIKETIQSHADDIGLRLNAYNYVIKNENGVTTKRGADTRPYAWPIAQTIANITGKPLDRYLKQVVLIDVGSKDAVLTASQLKGLYHGALDAIQTESCNIRFGEENRYLCNRFALAILNSLFVGSELFKEREDYIVQMSKDGDLLRSAFARVFAQKGEIPKNYPEELSSAVGQKISSATAPAKWCYMSRWIFLTKECPQDGDEWFFNGLDFLTFHDLLFAIDRY